MGCSRSCAEKRALALMASQGKHEDEKLNLNLEYVLDRILVTIFCVYTRKAWGTKEPESAGAQSAGKHENEKT